jgi:phosphoserine phosphatase
LNVLVLISITGVDRPGITAAVTRTLARFQANVLDIGQAVIHDALSLGMLVHLPDPAALEQVQEAVQRTIDELGNLTVRFLPIDEASYAGWVSRQGKPRHIVTLLARQITAYHISRLAEVIVSYGLNIYKIDRLSGRIPLESLGKNGQAVVEFSLRGPVADLTALRSDFMKLADELGVDIAYQQDNVFRRHRRLLAFDMDSTLIQVEVIDELAKRAGVVEQVAAITERAMRGEMDFKRSLIERVALLKGLPESALAEVAANLPLTEGAERLLNTVKRLGYKTAILSGGFTYFGHVLQKRFGIDYVFANELEIENGVLTGRIRGEIVDGAKKAEWLIRIAQQENISLEQVVAVGDGANDLPMLSIAGLGIAFRAKPIVKAMLQQSLSLGLDGILYLMGLRDRETL